MATNFIKELEQLTNPAPLIDHEDENEDIVAKVVEKDSLTDEPPVEISAFGLVPRRGVSLAEEDERYMGAVTTRSTIWDEEDSDNEFDGKESERSVNSQGEEGSGSQDEKNEEDDQEDQESIEESESEASDRVGNDAGDNDSTGLMKLFSNVDVRDENAKRRAVQVQIKLWEQLLGARIRYQRILGLINQLPQRDDDWRYLLESDASTSKIGDTNPSDDSKLYEESRRVLKASLDGLISLQDDLIKTQGGAAAADDDDEIASSPDEDEGEPAEGSKGGRKRRLNDIDDYSKFLGERDSELKPFRDEAILKWFEKTRLASGRFGRSSFANFETNAVQQIEQILSDRERLIKRTQFKRSKYSILGRKSEKVDGELIDSQGAEYEEEIFDDDDFYQQLLRELIERRTVGVTDPVTLSRQWLELQKLRSKSKKKLVDRRASKGRKCRYDVVPKLVNFMAPVDRCAVTDEAREELFSSLFKCGN